MGHLSFHKIIEGAVCADQLVIRLPAAVGGGGGGQGHCADAGQRFQMAMVEIGCFFSGGDNVLDIGIARKQRWYIVGHGIGDGAVGGTIDGATGEHVPKRDMVTRCKIARGFG